MSGSEMIGFSPMMYMPRTPLSGFTTSVTINPSLRDSVSGATPQAFAYSARIAGSFTER